MSGTEYNQAMKNYELSKKRGKDRGYLHKCADQIWNRMGRKVLPSKVTSDREGASLSTGEVKRAKNEIAVMFLVLFRFFGLRRIKGA